MYLEFGLEYNNLYVQSLLEKSLTDWSKKHSIKYRIKYYKDTLRVTFDDDNTYTFFCLTWNNENNNWANYRIIRDLNNRI